MSGRLNAGLLVRKGWAAPVGRAPDVDHASQALPALWHLPLHDIHGPVPAHRSPRLPGRLGERTGAMPDARAALTLRLDRGRHTRLKIVAARTGRTIQAMMLAVVDTCLAENGTECACLVERGDSLPGRSCAQRNS